MSELWNKYHAPQESSWVLESGVYDFTVERIVELVKDSIVLSFSIAGHGIAQRIYFDSEECTMARYLLASVGLLKNINSGWITSELANTVGKSGKCIIGSYELNGVVKNTIETFIAPWADEKEQWWKYQVLQKAGKTCAACGAPGFDAHHIKPKSIYPEERLLVSNGQCLCRACHKKWHDTYGNMRIGGPGL